MLEPKEMKIIQEKLGSLPVEIECFYYDGYMKAFANYYYSVEDSVTGSSESEKESVAIRDAIVDLREELKDFFANGNIWDTEQPGKGDPVKIWLRNHMLVLG